MAVDPVHLKLGVQIAYVPNHADGDIGHSDVQFGFVSSVTKFGVFCRYWLKKELLIGDVPELRTKANSELTPFDNLLVWDSVDHKIVDETIRNFK